MCSGPGIAMAAELFSREPVYDLVGLNPRRAWASGEGEEAEMRTTSAREAGPSTGLSLFDCALCPWPRLPWRLDERAAAAEPKVGKASSSLTASAEGVAVRDWWRLV